ncbi:9434_t:CDS:2, partial [Funneliformis caledonium]
MVMTITTIAITDEVIQILSGLDGSLSLNHKNTWNDISDHTELKFVLQQLHCHKRDNWKNSQDNTKSKIDKKRKGINSKHSEKKERRKRGIIHMYNINDDILTSSKPQSLSEKKYREDLEEIIDDGKYHSDEASETDNEKAQIKINEYISENQRVSEYEEVNKRVTE